ncbi:hypothetical protein T08_9560 [Trichinella sp. T8]|uniref:Uncharacterized protein n=1 Tax=Trichinella murrelli TaxID=144512 RepID=A0A0V0TAC4_9BILA|nr:hypothetical protein T05_9465 [Trichinella murrelli]KRZ85782.1 hypothetical protein T08_9560 [Trichinella sp. T8]
MGITKQTCIDKAVHSNTVLIFQLPQNYLKYEKQNKQTVFNCQIKELQYFVDLRRIKERKCFRCSVEIASKHTASAIKLACSFSIH